MLKAMIGNRALSVIQLKLNKRLLSTYLILYSVFKSKEFNLGEALEVLKLYETRKSAISDIKRLCKMGFLSRKGKLLYEAEEPYIALRNYLVKYIAKRIERRLKSLGIREQIDFNSKIVVKAEIKVKIPENPLISFQELR